MSQRKSGFTVIELLIVVAIVAILGGVVFGSVGSCGSSGAKANKEAQAFGREMGLTVKGVTCMDYDTNGDGYVSCTLNTVEQGMLPIECARSWSWNSGCRAAMVLRR